MIETQKTYIKFYYLVFAMNRWYMSQPKYTKAMESFYRTKDRPPEKTSKNKRKYINLLKQPDTNAREYLFTRYLPSSTYLQLISCSEFNLSLGLMLLICKKNM